MTRHDDAPAAQGTTPRAAGAAPAESTPAGMVPRDNRAMRRGTLRIYLGAAPGVGKTVKMLGEGRRRAERGTDVVVGYVETHGRAYTTAELAGLEVIPRREMTYRDSTFTEMDVDAILARRPQLVLVDELAHTNVPGSERRRRYEDIDVLLDAGIDVISTVNIQHLESLNDAVAAITGVRQRETVPDHVVRRAEQIELVDMTPEALRRRMAHGNVYKAEKVDAALASYFRPGNLAALRELALLWLADRVDEALERYRADQGIRATWPTRERIVVGLTGGPEGEQVLRRAARIASRGAGGELHAVYVTSDDGLTGPDFATIAAQRALTSDLGGTFHTVSGDDVAAAILDFARSVNASQIVLGSSRRTRLAHLFDPGVGEAVVAGSGDIDVHMVNHDLARSLRRPTVRSRAALSGRRRAAGFAVGLLGVAALTGLLLPLRGRHDLPLDVLLYLGLTVATALVGGLWPAIVTAVVGSLALNWFFAPPLHTFTIASGQNVVALVVFVLVAAAVSSVVHVSARRTAQALAAERESTSLTQVSHAMLASPDPLGFLVTECLDLFDMRAAGIVRRDPETHRLEVLAATDAFDPDERDAAVVEEIDDDTSLVLVGHVLRGEDQPLVSAYASHAAAVLTRRRLQAEAATASSLASDNRARTALLSAVSHDLRTPLAAVKAAVSSLRAADVEFSPEDEAELLASIEESADRLDALVGNLLDASRLQTGVVRPRCRAIDAAGEARAVVAGTSDPDRVQVRSDGPCPGWADPGLLERCLANLVENALRHAPGPVFVDVSTLGERTHLRVVDSGPGVPTEELERIFQPFQRRGDAPGGDGVGLGLAVARGLAETMDATVTADDTPGGGLTMVVDLPAHEPGTVSPSGA
ncbi:two-component histidine kinase [Mobilicoccus pelagius NBRC 104925]|uniref:histidine kinase n=2 Tax=Mobilicoccus TaxID=984996 RepID=H5UVE9_9MICO|nr:two-component histidine kinase [Mobilicoccus pelagius NBRC 104925]